MLCVLTLAWVARLHPIDERCLPTIRQALAGFLEREGQATGSDSL